MLLNQSFWKGRLQAAGIHLLISLALAVLAALLVFEVWYPYPYREISGGRELFFLVVAVDVVMGPLLTLAVFNRQKPIKELRRDLAIIGVLQLAALGYGFWTVAVARPVHLVFEVDRFRVVHAIEIPVESMNKAPAEFKRLPLAGPTLLSLREFKDEQERSDALMAEVAGIPLSVRPELWKPYEDDKAKVLAKGRSPDDLKKRFPEHVPAIDAALKQAAVKATDVIYIPMIGRQTFWTVLLDAHTAEVLAFVPIDSF